MEIKLILMACTVNFGLTFAQLHNQMANQVATSKADDESEIRENFQNLFDSITKNDKRQNKIYREILVQEVEREHRAFDTMKEELRIVRNRNSFKKDNVRKKSENRANVSTIKREINGNNSSREYQTVDGNTGGPRKVMKNSSESNKPTSQNSRDSIQNQLHRFLSGTTGQELRKNHENESSLTPQYNWNVMDILNGPFSVMMLNTPIVSPKFATSIWRKANFKILVDGGGNRLYDLLFNGSSKICSRELPDVLCGDFDSVCANVLNFFRELNVTVIHTPDQEETDFFKGLRVLSENTNDLNVLVYCDTVGRLDHIMNNLNTLFKCASHQTLSKYNIFLLNHKSLTWLLEPGSHKIDVPQRLWTEKSYCGLIPLGQPCHRVSTKGLKYNFRNGETQFGGMVSTSNGYDIASSRTEVHISTDNKMVWTMTIDEKLFR